MGRSKAWRFPGPATLPIWAASAGSSIMSSYRADDPRSDRHPVPDMVDGIQQPPIDGASIAYTFDKANADAPGRRTTQYFEMLGNRAIYNDGWVAATTPVTQPWVLSTTPPPEVLSACKWELYNVKEDPTQYDDLAAQMPEKVKQLQAIFESRKQRSTTCSRSTTRRCCAGTRRALTSLRGERVPTYTGELSGVPPSAAPSILNKSYTITADVEILLRVAPKA